MFANIVFYKRFSFEISILNYFVGHSVPHNFQMQWLKKSEQVFSDIALTVFAYFNTVRPNILTTLIISSTPKCLSVVHVREMIYIHSFSSAEV